MKTSMILITLALVGYAWCCLTDTDCPNTHCCLRQDIMIASKRQLVLPFNHHGGKCTLRQGLGKTCSSFTACGCKVGLKCQYLDHPLSVQTKRSVYFRPGTCQADLDI
ncbi:uncharacterized protein [Littorina saxatilis]|uniref:Uncharacterized protein n=1 Tax=Littorina saxatilis TaxID=31220 RepID=A0AAN9BX04_9CAEN